MPKFLRVLLRLLPGRSLWRRRNSLEVAGPKIVAVNVSAPDRAPRKTSGLVFSLEQQSCRFANVKAGRSRSRPRTERLPTSTPKRLQNSAPSLVTALASRGAFRAKPCLLASHLIPASHFAFSINVYAAIPLVRPDTGDALRSRYAPGPTFTPSALRVLAPSAARFPPLPSSFRGLFPLARRLNCAAPAIIAGRAAWRPLPARQH